MKITLLFSLLVLSLFLHLSALYGQSNYNTGIGSGTGGYYNVHVGVAAGKVSTGNYNNFIAMQAGLCNTTGSYNSFIGSTAGASNTTGSYNNFLGHAAGLSNTGSSNSFLGYGAGLSNTIVLIVAITNASKVDIQIQI